MKKLIACFLGLVASVLMAAGASVTLAWDPNPEPDIAGYKIYWRTNGQTYTTNWSVTITNGTTGTVTNLLLGRQYFFVATAFNTSGLESDYSNEVTAVIPGTPIPPRNLRTNQVILRASLLSSPKVDGSWATIYTFEDVKLTNTLDMEFYKTRLMVNVEPQGSIDGFEPENDSNRPGVPPPLPVVR